MAYTIKMADNKLSKKTHTGMTMKKKQPLIIVGLLLLIVAFYWARPHSRFLLTILPPSNLYSPLVKDPISLKEKTTFPNLQLKHDYVGTYLVGIYITKPPPLGTPIKSNAKLNLTISNKGNILYENKFSRLASSFGGPGGKESGVILGFYKVPDQIPLGLNSQATISIVSSDPTFEDNYGVVEFFIQRKSDQ